MGSNFTWENNKEGECFVDERLDGFFGVPNLLLNFPKARVIHMNKGRNKGDRDWQTWAQLKGRSHEAYKNEEIFWSQKEFNG